MADDSELTEEELAQVKRAWRGLVGQHAHQGRTYYEMPPVRGMAPPGAYRVPKNVIAALGQGDMKLGGYVLHAMLGVEDNPERPDLIDPNAVKIVGNGSARDGRRILDRFFQRVRQGAQPRNDSIEQPDGHSPDRVIR
jgi:hypothetical protein